MKHLEQISHIISSSSKKPFQFGSFFDFSMFIFCTYNMDRLDGKIVPFLPRYITSIR